MALNLTDFWTEASSHFIKMAPQQEVVLTDVMKAAIVIWIKFLNNCDDEVPEVMAADAVATVLVKNGVKTPKMASGSSEADINGLTGFLALPMDQKLMLKLSVSVAKATVTAKHGAEPRPPATPVSNMMGTQSAAQSSMAQVMGQEGPQRVVEAAMQEQPDLKLALNTKLSFESIPFHCQVDMSVFQAVK